MSKTWQEPDCSVAGKTFQAKDCDAAGKTWAAKDCSAAGKTWQGSCIPSGPISADSLVDLVFIQDLSGSFSNDLVNIRAFFVALIATFGTEDFPATDVRVALTSFVDYDGYGGRPGDYPYQLDLDFTSDYVAVQSQVDSWATLDGLDDPESQLYAVKQAAETLSYRPGAHRILVLSTDASYHDNDDDPFYPSEAQMASAVSAVSGTLLCLATSSQLSTYEGLLSNNSIAGAVVAITSNSSNMLTAFLTAVDNAIGVS